MLLWSVSVHTNITRRLLFHIARQCLRFLLDLFTLIGMRILYKLWIARLPCEFAQSTKVLFVSHLVCPEKWQRWCSHGHDSVLHALDPGEICYPLRHHSEKQQNAMLSSNRRVCFIEIRKHFEQLVPSPLLFVITKMVVAVIALCISLGMPIRRKQKIQRSTSAHRLRNTGQAICISGGFIVMILFGSIVTSDKGVVEFQSFDFGRANRNGRDDLVLIIQCE